MHGGRDGTGLVSCLQDLCGFFSSAIVFFVAGGIINAEGFRWPAFWLAVVILACVKLYVLRMFLRMLFQLEKEKASVNDGAFELVGSDISKHSRGGDDLTNIQEDEVGIYRVQSGGHVNPSSYAGISDSSNVTLGVASSSTRRR